MSTREHSVQPGRITTPATVVGPSTTDAPTPEQSAADVPARPAPRRPLGRGRKQRTLGELHRPRGQQIALTVLVLAAGLILDRKSTRLNSSHVAISYAVFCL